MRSKRCQCFKIPPTTIYIEWIPGSFQIPCNQLHCRISGSLVPSLRNSKRSPAFKGPTFLYLPPYKNSTPKGTANFFRRNWSILRFISLKLTGQIQQLSTVDGAHSLASFRSPPGPQTRSAYLRLEMQIFA